MVQPPDPLPSSHAIASPHLKRLRALSHLLDNAVPIPGTNYRVGIDPLLGLLPGGGDIVGAVLSAYIVVSATQMGLPRETLLQMIYNILLETVAGTVPVVGDIFDVAWKANVKNLALLERHLNVPHARPAKKIDKLFIFILLAGLILATIAIAAFGVWLISSLINLVVR